MARLPQIQRRNLISQEALQQGQAGQTWAALSDLASSAATVLRPAALDQARREGENAVYRDEAGTLQVDTKNILGGELAAAHNAAAFAGYLAESRVDMTTNFSELARDHQFDPQAFKTVSDDYIKVLSAQAPDGIRSQIRSMAQQEQAARFNGLQNASIQRTQSKTNRATKLAREMLAEDAISLFMQEGQSAAFRAKMGEIEGITQYRADAAFIGETPQEAEGYLRGVRANAKAARLVRRLEDLGGATSIEETVRAEIEGTLSDPDLSPNQRQRLYAATQGEFKRVDANAIAERLTSDAYDMKVMRAESGGDRTVQNPRSSAFGARQFLKGTWRENVRELRELGQAKWAAGLSDTELLAMRADPEAEQEVFAHFRKKNQAALSGAGLPINDATEYLAHFLGAGGAIDVLSATPDAALADLLPARVIAANPHLKGMTARDIVNWAARRMTVKASDIAAAQSELADIEDLELHGLAVTRLNQMRSDRAALETETFLAYETRQTRGEQITVQEVLEDNNLSDQAQNDLTGDIARAHKDAIEIQETLATLYDGTFQDPRNAGQNRATDTAYEALIGAGDPLGTPEAMVGAAEISAQRGRVPKPMFNALIGAVESNDPARAMLAMEFTNRLIDQHPNAIGIHASSGPLQTAMADYRFFSQFMDGMAAAERVLDIRTPEHQAQLKNLSDQADEIVDALSPEDLVDAFDDRGLVGSVFASGPQLGSDQQTAQIMSEFKRLTRTEFLSTGDAALAKNRATQQIKSIYAVSPLAGNRIMKFPPERAYPAINGSHDWLREDLEREVTTFFQGEIGSGRRIRAGDIRIVSDPTTRSEFLSGAAPSYQVFAMRDGILQLIPQRFQFNAEPFQRAAEIEFNAGRSRAEVDRLREIARSRGSDFADEVRRREFERARGAEPGRADGSQSGAGP